MRTPSEIDLQCIVESLEAMACLPTCDPRSLTPVTLANLNDLKECITDLMTYLSHLRGTLLFEGLQVLQENLEAFAILITAVASMRKIQIEMLNAFDNDLREQQQLLLLNQIVRYSEKELTA